MKSLSSLLLCAGLATATALPAAEPVKADGYTYVKTVGNISEYTLDHNGLTVLLLPNRTVPVVTLMITFRVGSRNEVTGTTGATHLLEHLMFKGTEKYNDAKGNSVKQFLETIGGNYNATTWLDRTNYYAEIGSEHLEGYLAIQADCMRHLRLLESDRQPEMTVVRNEFEIGENNPTEALDKEMTATAYQAHPYHHSTIGWRSDIEKVSIDKLREFYNTFYWPDNSTVTLIGDFDPAAGLALVKKYYGVYPRAPQPIPQVYTEEPAQTGPRRVTVKRAGQLGVVGVAYKTPSGSHPDYAALNLLASILANGKNSRLYRALTDQTLTTSVSALVGFFHDPTLLNLWADLAPGTTHEQAEKIILAEVARIKTDGVTDAEVTAAINKQVAQIAFGRDGSFAIASNINEDIAAGDWTLFYTLEAAYQKVTAADIKRVANQYLLEDQSTTGWFIPLVAAAPAAQ
ncbi:MAG: insulinase family protein [Opitutaceae bacterium]|jgi:zinc protease|nr:insulinase family protein [Opitutaceae bacterium]